MLSLSNGQSVRLDEVFSNKETATIGRHSSCDIYLEAQPGPKSRIYMSISQKHAILHLNRDAGLLYLRDNESKNGTFVNGGKLETSKPWPLKNGDIISFARAGEFSTSGKKVYPYALTVKDLQSFLGRFGRGKVGGQICQEKLGDALLIKKEPNASANKMQGNRPMPFLTKYPPKYLGSYMVPQSHDISGMPKSKTELIDLTGDDDSDGPSGQANTRPATKEMPKERIQGPSGQSKVGCSGPKPGTPDTFHQRLQEVASKQFECSICCELMYPVYSIAPCGHQNCGACLAMLFSNERGNVKCPTCREVMSGPPIRVHTFDTFIESAIVDSLSAEEKKAREEKMKKWEEKKDEIEETLSTLGSLPNPRVRARNGLPGLEARAPRVVIPRVLMGDIGGPYDPWRDQYEGQEIAPKRMLQVAYSIQENKEPSECSKCKENIQSLDLKFGTKVGEENFSWFHLECVSASVKMDALTRGIKNYKTLKQDQQNQLINRLLAGA